MSSYPIAKWQKPEGYCEIVHQVRDGHSLETWLTGYVVFDKDNDPMPGRRPQGVEKFDRFDSIAYGLSYWSQPLDVLQAIEDLNDLYDMLIERRNGNVLV